MSEWGSLVKGRLGTNDQIQKSYYMAYERKAGILVLTNKKLIFVEEKGFLKKSHNIVLEMPYEKIKQTKAEWRDQLSIIDTEGKKYAFLARDMSLDVAVVEGAIREQMPIPGAIA